MSLFFCATIICCRAVGLVKNRKSRSKESVGTCLYSISFWYLFSYFLSFYYTFNLSQSPIFINVRGESPLKQKSQSTKNGSNGTHGLHLGSITSSSSTDQFQLRFIRVSESSVLQKQLIAYVRNGALRSTRINIEADRGSLTSTVRVRVDNSGGTRSGAGQTSTNGGRCSSQTQSIDRRKTSSLIATLINDTTESSTSQLFAVM